MSKTFPRTPRQERDEAMLELVELVEEKLPAARTALATCARALQHVEEHSSKATRHLRQAQQLQDAPYDGVERRRQGVAA